MARVARDFNARFSIAAVSARGGTRPMETRIDPA
jgi:hypothetical protein